MRVRLLHKPKPKSYTESFAVNEAGRWTQPVILGIHNEFIYLPFEVHKIYKYINKYIDKSIALRYN